MRFVKAEQIEKLKPMDGNARAHEDLDVDAVVRSMEKFGWTNPILVQEKTNTVIAGHGRLLAARKRGVATDDAFRSIAFSAKIKKANARKRLDIFQHNFDIEPYIRAYSLDEVHPCWFLRGYVDESKIRIIASKMRRDMELGITPKLNSINERKEKRARGKQVLTMVTA